MGSNPHFTSGFAIGLIIGLILGVIAVKEGFI